MAANLKNIRIVLWVVVAFVAVAATGLYLFETGPGAQASPLGEGDYQLTTAEGEPFTYASLKGHPSALFFGFTHCPEVCPTTLAEMTSWYQALGADAQDLKAYFVTVDPERDTADIVRDYVAWTGTVTGITGTPAEIEKMIAAWKIAAKKVPLDDGDYTMDHTASVFLLNRDGQFEGTIAYREDSATAVGKLRKLIEEDS